MKYKVLYRLLYGISTSGLSETLSETKEIFIHEKKVFWKKIFIKTKVASNQGQT